MKSKHDIDKLKSLLNRNINREKKLAEYIKEEKVTVKKVKNPDTGEEKEYKITPIHYKKRLRRVKRRIKRLNLMIEKIQGSSKESKTE